MLKLSHEVPVPTSDSSPSPTQPEAPKLILDGFVRREQLARLLDVSARTLDRWETLRKGPPRLCCGRTVLYDLKAVQDWLRSLPRHSCAANSRHKRTSNTAAESPSR
jgi:hypothetical protein